MCDVCILFELFNIDYYCRYFWRVASNHNWMASSAQEDGQHQAGSEGKYLQF